MVSGFPKPIIRWKKDGIIALDNKNSGIRLIENGQGLEIVEAKLEHAGVWTCEASNAAGNAHYEINLDIWTLPTVSIYPEDNVKPVDSSVVIKCEVRGNPEPSISWSKDGQPLITSFEGARISFKGARLDIPRLKQSHVGEYTCTAVNEVGTSFATVLVDVLVPPMINRDNIEMSPRLPTAQTLTLICDVRGKPLPQISWLTWIGLAFRYVNDTLLRETHSNVIIGEGGRYLQVSDINLRDRGAYKCVATNIAGKDELLYTVAIVQAPTVLNGGTQQVVEGEEARILCDVSGEPTPIVTWQRNGIRIETGIRYIIEDQTLRLPDVRSSDSGLYVCMATNEAGSAQQAFTLEVLVVPRIVTTSPNESVVPVGTPFSLKCGARGYPSPDIIWSVNEHVIGENDEVYSVAEDGTLFVDEVTEQKRLVFKCRAENNAGSHVKEYIVETIGPPIVTKKGIKTINTTEDEPTLLLCEIEGQIPEILWFKDNAPLVLKPNVELSADRTQLKIHNSKLHDEGLYSCVAVNQAGNATQKQQLYVGVPPRITEKPRRIVVKSGQAAEMWCEAVGIPTPHITWLKDDKALLQTALDDHTELLKSTAFFANVSSRDAGVYTCKAENWAGTSYKDVDLVVLIPPEIHPERMNITANVDETVTLTCNTTGTPEPVVSWMKMPNIDIIGSEEKYRIYGTTLHIKNVGSEDDGFYHCVAKSNAGQAIGSRRLIVKVPKKDYKVIWVECDELGQPIKTTYVPARGDVPEDGKTFLPWKQEYQDLPENGTNGVLIKCLPGGRETRDTAFAAIPRFTRSPKSQAVSPGSFASLHCSAIGHPTPHIMWMRHGAYIKNRSYSTSGHSILRVKIESDDDVGEYICLAQNTVGAATSIATLTMKGRKVEKVHARSVALLNCMLNDQILNQNVVWKFFGSSLNNSNGKVNIMRNGSLVVYDVTKSNLLDISPYHCYTKNGKGEIGVNLMQILEEVPHVHVSPKQILANLNESLTLNCITNFDPLTTSIHWTKNDGKVKNDERIRILINNSLHISKLLLSDRAIFKCIASNRYGKSFDDVKVIVRDGPLDVINKIEGTVNGKRIKREAVMMSVDPQLEFNVVTVNTKSFFNNEGSPESSADTLLSYMLAASPQLAFNPWQKKSLAEMEFHRITNYHFESGQNLRINQEWQTLNENYSKLNVNIDGQVPHIKNDVNTC
ncbi:unnamed protein product [Thelazia callipaeda]|uniref:Hemicentin-1 n=1 Tax=Thelazia callipaeda TaxID=103827 RepID=A0A158RBW2_THECL|nr:unnamed protein product [Thelazia callipaeda]